LETTENPHHTQPDMRLTDTQRQVITDTIFGVDADAAVYLSAPRRRSGQRGDIDLLVLSSISTDGDT